MKKIININLSGRVIPIEDAAYESLQRYIESLRRYFATEEGRDEIINDIESRIAELMNEKVKKGASAVTEGDIEEIIASMGRVEDFEAADPTENNTTTENTTFSNAYTGTAPKRKRGRMYRDKSDKFLGGVCSGIANYINFDPAIVRLLFAIITFGGFGFGILVYILAWIILPAKDLDGYVGKRLFRNPEDKILGGVAGGLGAYFGKETWMVRLVFAAPIILNVILSGINSVFSLRNHYYGPDIFFGSFTGTFILIYIILWIVLPEAKSPFEKMEMRGEKVDVNRIRQNVQEGMSTIRDRAQSWGEEVKTSAQEFSQRANTFAQTRGRTFATEVSNTAQPVARGIGHIIGVLFKAFFLFIAGTVAFALFVMVLVFTLGGAAQPFNMYLIDGFAQKAALWGVMIFFLAVPLIALITWMVRRAMKVRSQNRYLGWTFSGLWLLGWISLGLFVSTLFGDFRTTGKIEERINVAQQNMNRMVVRIDEPAITYSGTFGWLNDEDEDDNSGWDITEDTLRISNVKVRIAKSEDGLYHVRQIRYSNGSNRNEAEKRAQQIVYTTQSLDSALLLGNGFGIGEKEKFRNQRVIVEIKVPVGKQIMIDESVEYKLHDAKIHIADKRNWRRNRRDRDWDDTNFYNWKPGVTYTMTATGDLVDIAQPANSNNSGVYEYKGGTNTNIDTAVNGPDSVTLDQQIKEQQRRIEAEQLRLKQLQRNKRAATGKLKTTGISTPIFSLLV